MTLYEITQKIQQDIAQVSTGLVESEQLTANIPVVIQDDIMLYDEIMELTSQRIVPCVLKVERSLITESDLQETLNGVLWFYVPIEKRDNLYLLLDTYRQIENAEKHELFGDYLITKTVQRYKFDEYKKAQNGLDDYMFVLRMDFTWVITSGFVAGKHFKLEVKTGSDVDYTQIPFVTYNMVNTKAYVSNVNEGTNEYLTDDDVIINVPLTLGNAKILEMYNDVDNNSYNKLYTFRLTVGSSIKVKELILKRGEYIVENSNKLVGLTLRYGAMYDRSSVLLDDVSVKLTDYTYDLTKGETPRRDGKTNKIKATEINRTWQVSIVDDNSDLYKALQDEIYGDTQSNHTLKITTKASNLYTYSVQVTKGVEGYKETRSALTLTLKEV